MESPSLNHDAYTVGWVATLDCELDAARLSLDKEHKSLPAAPDDPNSYILGEIGVHNVTVVFPPEGQSGISPATHIVTNMTRTFRNIRFVLLVGIGGGAPAAPNVENPVMDIHLGDVIVSCPDGNDGGIVHHDKGKLTDGGLQLAAHVNKPPGWLLTKVKQLRSDRRMHRSRMIEYLRSVQDQILQIQELAAYQFPGREYDKLFKSTSQHVSGDSCLLCDQNALLTRSKRKEPIVHHGLIASGSQIMRSAKRRDELRAQRNVLCFETEAIGLVDNFPCLVIRGISDYADSHKNDLWQGYAAITSAAYAKDLLRLVERKEVEEKETILIVTERLAQRVALIEETVLSIKSAKDKTRSQEILTWLSPLEFSDEQAAYLEKMASGTGQWFLASDELQSMATGNNITVYCHGIPGAGKSVLASLAVDYFYTLRRRNPKIGIAYIFFSLRREDVQTLAGLLACIAKQFAQQYPNVPQVVEEFYGLHYEEKRRPSAQELYSLLRDLINGLEVGIIVLDALDECRNSNGTQVKFLQNLLRLQKDTHRTATNILVTSRTNDNIRALFSKATNTVEIRAQNEDIVKYLDAEMDSVPLGHLDEDLRGQVRHRVVQAADGMFLIARLHMNHIITLPTRGHIEDALENMMDGLGELDQLYSAAMARIGNKGRFARELAQKIFAWVLHVKRPLVTKELQHALAIQANTKDLDRTLIAKYFSDVGHLQSVCEGLVEVDSRNTVRLAHYTTYEYFDRLPLAWLTTSKAHVADMCLTYLSYDVFGRDFCFGDAGYETMLHDYPFYGYCSQYWGAQVRDADMDKDDFVFRLLINKEQLANCSHVMLSLDNPFADDEDGVPTDLPPMHVAAWFGLVGSLARLIQLGGEIDAKDTQARTPLMWAVAGSRISTVEWLLSNYGVDVNAADLSGATPLYTAIYHGDEDMVRILLRRGEVNMSHQDSFRATPLHIACMENQTTIAQMLLASGKVNVNARDCDGWTPLCMSVRNDDPATIKVLLKAEGIELNFRDGAGLVPLVIAASEGSISVVELLLQTEGIDVNFRDAHNMTPIFAAALQGHDLVVAVLLRVPGIELNTQDASNPLSPITAAMWRGHASVVKVFLNSGMIDVNAIDAFGYTPLMRAASLGHESVVRALLSIKDTVITRQNMHWQKAIALAAGSGHSSIARLLRESLPPEPPSNSAQETGHPAQQAFNADEKQSFVPSGESSILEWQNRGNSTSQHSRLAPEELDHELFITVSQGRIERLSALLIHNNGVSMNHRVNERRTPLLLQAVLSNQLPTAVYLLLRQADPNLKDSVGLTPLVAAAASGDVLMALTLIKYGAHPDIAHDEGPTPLVTAVIHEHAEMVWCLLKKGADPNHCMTPESSGLSPLVVAILLGNEKIARILLDHDCVDVSTRDEQNISTCALALAKGMDFVFRHIYDKLIARA